MTDKTYLAQPSGACCLTGHVHTGEPRGTIEKITDLDTYITRPPPGTKANGHIVLYFPDVWGFFKNGFLVMDGFADLGYTTVGVDYFRGDPVWLHRKDRNDSTSQPSGWDFEKWKDENMAFALSAVPGWVEAVREKLGAPGTKFACVG